ncbi:MAG: sulfurtransferase, partial [Caldilineaceae bacterium]
PHLRPHLVADAAEIAARLGDPTLRLLDARSFERFRGQNETIDPVAGHIPGAHTAPYAGNLTPDGSWQSANALRDRYTQLLAGTPPEQTVVYCGSGVSAAHLLIALEQAGMPGARLYPGSWSDWITDPTRPIASGDEAAP